MYVCMYLCHKEYTCARTHELAHARTCPRAHTLIHTHTHTQMKTFMGIVGFSVVNASIHDAAGSMSGKLSLLPPHSLPFHCPSLSCLSPPCTHTPMHILPPPHTHYTHTQGGHTTQIIGTFSWAPNESSVHTATNRLQERGGAIQEGKVHNSEEERIKELEAPVSRLDNDVKKSYEQKELHGEALAVRCSLDINAPEMCITNFLLRYFQIIEQL